MGEGAKLTRPIVRSILERESGECMSKLFSICMKWTELGEEEQELRSNNFLSYIWMANGNCVWKRYGFRMGGRGIALTEIAIKPGFPKHALTVA